MHIIQTIILILFFICCFILILLVLIQSGKGGGLNLVGGGNTGMQATRMDAITKITWVAGISFFILGIMAAVTFADAGPKIDGNANKDPLSLPIKKATSPETKTETNTQKPIDPSKNK